MLGLGQGKGVACRDYHVERAREVGEAGRVRRVRSPNPCHGTEFSEQVWKSESRLHLHGPKDETPASRPRSAPKPNTKKIRASNPAADRPDPAAIVSPSLSDTRTRVRPWAPSSLVSAGHRHANSDRRRARCPMPCHAMPSHQFARPSLAQLDRL